MEDALVMTILGLKSAGDAFVKKLISTASSIPKRIFKTLFGIQLKIIYLTLGCLVRIYRVVQNTFLFKYIFPENVSSSEPVVDQEAVVKGAKKVRRALCLSLEQYYGLHIKSDLDLLEERLDEYHRCMEEDDDDKTFEALAKLKELNKPFEDDSWKEKYITDLEVLEYTDESEAEDKPTNMLEKQDCDQNKVTSKVNKKQEYSNLNGIKRVKQLNDSQSQTSRRNSLENGPLKSRVTVTNAKLEEVLKMSSNLVGELTQLNGNVSRLAVVSEKMSNIQNELGEGMKVLGEIEADRNAMKRKLSILERMIQEEEQYLDDLSCESGYEECETSNPPEC